MYLMSFILIRIVYVEKQNLSFSIAKAKHKELIKNILR